MSDPNQTSTEPPRRIPRLGWAIAFIGFVMAVALAFSQMKEFRDRQAPSGLEKLASVPEFTLVDQSGETISLSDLKGSPWVANFVFTTCKGPCPLMSARMSELSTKLGKAEDVRLVSFTVDPENDSPEVLDAYATDLQADPDQWSFVTGEPDQVRELIGKGFLQPLGEGKEGEPIHSTRFVVVDGNGDIRSFREGMDPEVLQKILVDLGGLLREQKSASNVIPET